MTLEQLRSRASASELTLINEVIKLVQTEEVEKIRDKIGEFARNNRVPVDERFVGWARRLIENLSE